MCGLRALYGREEERKKIREKEILAVAISAAARLTRSERDGRLSRERERERVPDVLAATQKVPADNATNEDVVSSSYQLVIFSQIHQKPSTTPKIKERENGVLLFFFFFSISF